jgi:hypothetical protein
LGHNPLAKELKEKATQLEGLQGRRAELIADLDWHRDFQRAAAVQVVETRQATCAALEAEKADVTRELAAGRKEGQELQRKTKLGMNPAYWFSIERHAAKERGAELFGVLIELEERETKLTGRLARARRALGTASRALTKFDEFNVYATEAEIAALDAEIPLLQLEHDNLAERKRALDRLLKEPVKALKSLRDEERRVERERSALRSRVDELERDIDRASRFERELNQAANSYERAKIHEECEDRLGDGRPRAIMGDRRRKLTEAKREIATKDRQMEGIRRNVAKARDRVAKVVDRGTRDVRALVVDGSNLCYQGGTFIGLAALRPLCSHLAGTYNVTLVFDASIRHKLGGATDRDLRDAFPESTVHAVASRTKADETILATAEDPFVFVLSNDRFSEYREKPAVKEARLIRHEIINGRVLVHDLDVSVPFAAKD